jgi:hypothetical protein
VTVKINLVSIASEALDTKMCCSINGANCDVPKVHFEALAVPLKHSKVVRRGFNRHNVGFWVPRGKPEDADANVCTTIHNQRFLSRVDDITKEAFCQTALRAPRQFVLQFLEAFIENKLVAPAPVFDAELPFPI